MDEALAEIAHEADRGAPRAGAPGRCASPTSGRGPGRSPSRCSRPCGGGAWTTRVEVVAVDVSPEALDLARENAVGHGVADRMVFREGDLLPAGDSPYDAGLREPAVRAGAARSTASRRELAFEPRARARRRAGRAGRDPAAAGPAAGACSPGTGWRCWRSGRTRAMRSPATVGRRASGLAMPGDPGPRRAAAARPRRAPGRRPGDVVRDHRPGVRPEPEFPVRMLALDIDGTLVGADVRLSERITAVIGEAVRRGVKVSLATGRMPSSAVVFANQLGLVRADHRPPGRRDPRDARARLPGGPTARRSVPASPFLGRVGRLLHHEPMRPGGRARRPRAGAWPTTWTPT